MIIFVKMRISGQNAVLFGVTVNILLWQKGLGEIGCYKIVMAKRISLDIQNTEIIMLQESPVLEFLIEYLMRSFLQSFFLILPSSS